MNEIEAKVIDLQAFRTRKTLIGDRKSGVHQAFRPESTLKTRKVDGGNVSDTDLSARIERIKSSISRINQLMTELRSMSGSDTQKK